MEARRILRRIELEAYGAIVSAFRAEGPLTIEKKAVLTKLSQLLSISPDRHHAEVRRAICDEQLSFIADCVSGITDSRRSWLPEGKRTGGRGNPRLVARHALSGGTVQGQALAAITLSNKLNKQEVSSDEERKLPQQVQQALKAIAGQHQSTNTSVPPTLSRPKAPPTTLLRSISCQTDEYTIATVTTTDIGIQIMSPLLVDIGINCNIEEPCPLSISNEPQPSPHTLTCHTSDDTISIDNKPHQSISNEPCPPNINNSNKPHPPINEELRHSLKRTASLQDDETPPTKVLRCETPPNNTDSCSDNNVTNSPTDDKISINSSIGISQDSTSTSQDVTPVTSSSNSIDLIESKKKETIDTISNDNFTIADNVVSSNATIDSQVSTLSNEETFSSKDTIPSLSFQLAPSLKEDTLILSSSFTSSIPSVQVPSLSSVQAPNLPSIEDNLSSMEAPNLSSIKASNLPSIEDNLSSVQSPLHVSSSATNTNVFFPSSNDTTNNTNTTPLREGPSSPSAPLLTTEGVPDETTLLKVVTDELGVDAIDPSLLNMADLLSLLQHDDDPLVSTLELTTGDLSSSNGGGEGERDGNPSNAELIVLQQSGSDTPMEIEFSEEELLDNLPEELRETVQAILDNNNS